MKRTGNDIIWMVVVFTISRILLHFFGVGFQYDALYKYWQYLDVDTLNNNLWRGVWYDHAQPPFFNLFLGVILKTFGAYSETVFIILFKLITFVNALLILCIARQFISHKHIPLILSLVYLLSPASMIFENELFYTTFISMLLLTSSFFILKANASVSWKLSIGIFFPLVVVALSRSMYHLVWLAVIAGGIVFLYRKQGGWKLFVTGAFSVLLVGSWYVKNYFLFEKFTTSTWIGMNLSRNVFHDAGGNGEGIRAVEPFSPISLYQPYISGRYEKKFAGVNDKDLLMEFKNSSDTLINLNHINYIEVSDAYFKASKEHIKADPLSYIKNVAQSSIIFFSPATRYPLAEAQARRIWYYDVVYSFNLSHFARGKQQKRVALTISAIPKLLMYLLAFFFLIRSCIKERQISAFHFFILSTTAYVFVVSSLVEHYENMRFRYEVEPFFLIVLGQFIYFYLKRKTKPGHSRQS